EVASIQRAEAGTPRYWWSLQSGRHYSRRPRSWTVPSESPAPSLPSAYIRCKTASPQPRQEPVSPRHTKFASDKKVRSSSPLSQIRRTLKLAENPLCVQVIDLFQRRVGQIHPVYFPSPLPRIAPIIKIFV